MNAVLITVIIASVVVIAVLVVAIIFMRSTIAGLGSQVSESQRASGAMINQQLNDAMAQINRNMGEMRNVISLPGWTI